jgi:FlaA1/EpsC-like NDP-sugar epimerase
MYEELYSGSEERLSTTHPKIIHLRFRATPAADLPRAIAELERLARTRPQKVVAQLQAIVPEYGRPNISLFLLDDSAGPKKKRPLAA